jgi:glycerate dehydrogenase
MKIVFLDALTVGKDMDLRDFSKIGDFNCYQASSVSESVERMKDADIVITNKVQLKEENLSKAKELKLICLTATGTNNVDLDYCKKKGIAVCNVAGYSTASVTQHTFSLLFYILEKLNFYDSYVKEGRYSKCDIFTFLEPPFSELSGKIFGIIGLGDIGRSVARVATAFGCKVCYYSTSGANQNPDYERVELEALLGKSDVISIHAPLNSSTIDLIKYEELKLMKSNAILLNLGRGGIVNETDLARALEEDLIAGAGLDVLVKEPIPLDNPLMKIKDKSKLFITPHIAWASIEARTRLLVEVEKNIEAFLLGEKRSRVV